MTPLSRFKYYETHSTLFGSRPWESIRDRLQVQQYFLVRSQICSFLRELWRL